MFIDLCSKRQCHRQKDLIRNKEDKEFGCGYSLTFPKDAKNILWLVKHSVNWKAKLVLMIE